MKKIITWWKNLALQNKYFILGLIASILGNISVLILDRPLAIILFPFFLLIVFVDIVYELIFGFQGEFGALRIAMNLSLIIYPLLGYLIGIIITKVKEGKINAKR